MEDDLKKKTFKHLLVQVESDDITAMETKFSVSTWIMKKVSSKAEQIIILPEKTTKNHPQLMKILIMGVAPRFDDHSKYKHKIKLDLAKHFNNVIKKLLHKSSMKNKIQFGEHLQPEKS